MLIKSKKGTIYTDNICYNGNGWFEFKDCYVKRNNKTEYYNIFIINNKDIVEVKKNEQKTEEHKK